tara:strand:+ start:2035 stop:2649 length:615 start_codon:yes stop_codon:yes gene_type:complete
MSYKLVDAVINHDIGDGLAKFVLIALARFANESGQCFPSINTLCKITHLSRQTVITKIKWLDKHGFVQRSPTPGRSMRYTIPVNLFDQPVKEIDPKLSISNQRTNNRHPVPDDWTADEKLRASINKTTGKEIDHDYEEVRFRDWYAATEDKFANWEPRYRSWCNNERARIVGGTDYAPVSGPTRNRQGSSYFAAAAENISDTNI